MKQKEKRGRKKLPTCEKKKLVQIMIKSKSLAKATAEIKLIAKKYNGDGSSGAEISD